MANPNLARKTVDPTSQTSGGEMSALSSVLPAGIIFDTAATVAPTGWLFCDGSAVSRTTYAALFAAIGTTYGAGNGTTTFNLPDSRGRTRAGKDDMGGVAANRLTAVGSGITGTTLGANGGSEAHTLTTAQLPQHNHSIPWSPGNAGGAAGSGVVFAGTAATTTGNQGTGSSHQNTQPTIVFNTIIKY